MDGMEMTATSTQATSSALVVALTGRLTPGYLRALRSDVQKVLPVFLAEIT